MSNQTEQAHTLRATWVPITGADGRTRMEMRWADTSRPAHAAPQAA